MGTYVKVVPVGHQKEWGEREATPTKFVLEPGIVSQEELESAAEDFNIPLVCDDRGTAEGAASRLGTILVARRARGA